MSPRERRLFSDMRLMEQLADRGELAFRADGSPAERYEVMFSVPGLGRNKAGELAVRRLHRCEIYLHRDYPRRPPVVTWLTPVFHPNLLSPERNGGVCIGSWSPSESLADLCLRLRDLASYRSLNAYDALDTEAGAWVRRHDIRAGADVEEIVQLPLEEEMHITVGKEGLAL